MTPLPPPWCITIEESRWHPFATRKLRRRLAEYTEAYTELSCSTPAVDKLIPAILRNAQGHPYPTPAVRVDKVIDTKTVATIKPQVAYVPPPQKFEGPSYVYVPGQAPSKRTLPWNIHRVKRWLKQKERRLRYLQSEVERYRQDPRLLYNRLFRRYVRPRLVRYYERQRFEDARIFI